MPSYRFQDGLTLDRHIGQTLTVHGENFELKEILSEKQSNEFNERWAVFQATKSGSTDAFVLKLRFQQNPSRLSQSKKDSIQVTAKRNFETECKALRVCSPTGVAPRFFHSEELRQNNTHPFPGGYLRVIVMSKVGGKSVIEILEDLYEEDRRIIRTQLILILESLVGLSRASKEMLPPEEGDPITENSIDVLAFGMGWTVSGN
ncbi:hypothetical protein VTN96DRAFT_9234 [Rasamsonia emersonii]|uniref:Protein kinase domain-containing protein n=1 Tax=Rasamsonia emersonii (strain ATCC 16479 / CBS 393.64 / IMI 116815) TaxID=1408163 RepID=A0A0F4YH39_RASE3|nr:hypothetical protein T310_9423 [Rasamsonia emersonii CBS 393.64]KKA16963.1 hypothetical protein T310_9423 [Rasamsonia emersonii CBS 393.64]